MKILVCGGRDYEDRDAVYRTLDAIHKKHGITCLVHGAAKGADTFAAHWTREHKIEERGYRPDWEKHGKAAGPIRNRAMVKWNPDIDVVIAFPGGAGTADMKSVAEEAGIDVYDAPFV